MITCTVVDTITGVPQGQIQPATFSGGRVIDDPSSGKLQMALPAVPYTRAAMDNLTTKMARSVVFSINRVPLALMPFTDEDWSDDTHELDMSMDDVWFILGGRTTLGPNGYSGDQDTANKLWLQNISLPSIVGYLLAAGTDGPTANFGLPLHLPEGKITLALMDAIRQAGTAERKYEDHEFQFIAECLNELAKLGVEVDFEPRWSAAGNLELLARIGRMTGGTFSCNMTSEKPWLFNVRRRVNADKQANVIYSVGKGEDRDMRVTTSRAATSVPAREHAEPFKDIDDLAVLQAHSDAGLVTFNKPTTQWEMSMLADSTGINGPRIEDMRIGSTVSLYYKDHPRFPDGWTDLRLIGFTFDQTETIRLTLQPIGA